MGSYLTFAVVYFILSAGHLVDGQLEDSLKYWERLSISKIQRHIIKRDSGSHHPLQQLIKFDSYGRHFSLVLRKDHSVIAPDFKIVVMNADGQEREVQPRINLYRGTVEGEPNSFVSAYLNDDNVLSAAFQTSSDFYVVEPAWHLLPNVSHDSMIIYRNSDLRWDNNSLCGYEEAEVNANETFMHHRNFWLNNLTKPDQKKERSRRATCTATDKNTCPLYVAIDPRFFANVGEKNILNTVTYVLSDVDRVDQIYRRHKFEGCDKGFGFEIKKIRIFPQQTVGYSYTKIQTFATTDLLDKFSEDPDLPNFCLGHLYTYQTLTSKGYVLGLGYIGSPLPDKVGGICSYDSAENFNVGYTTFYSYKRMPALQTLLVTAHEMGHNWGATHDEVTEECSPSASMGGKYLMYPISVSGTDKNNWVFSPCSIRGIGATLQQKSVCFQVKRGAFCGNYIVESGEQCDPGFNVISSTDPCCDSNCILRASAQCSDLNSPCCRNCQIIKDNSNVTCFKTSPDFCRQDSFCNGSKASCPEAKAKPDGTKCFNEGQCSAGECKSMCNVYGYESCSCDTVEAACKYCCMNRQGVCGPFAGDGKAVKNMPEGMPCIIGACDKNGVCAPTVRGVIHRLWQILDLSSPGNFVKFMRNNIVITVIVLSLIVWIPPSCAICYLDRVENRERNKMIEEIVEETLGKTETGDARGDAAAAAGGGSGGGGSAVAATTTAITVDVAAAGTADAGATDVGAAGTAGASGVDLGAAGSANADGADVEAAGSEAINDVISGITGTAAAAGTAVVTFAQGLMTRKQRRSQIEKERLRKFVQQVVLPVDDISEPAEKTNLQNHPANHLRKLTSTLDRQALQDEKN